MNVEKEIAGFVLPFTVGVLLTACIGLSFYHNHALITFIALITISITICLLNFSISVNERSICADPRILWGIIVVAACSCGVLSGATGLSLIDMPESGIETAAINFSNNLKGAIDNIPFHSEHTGALVKALLTGEKSSLSDDIKEAFRDSGASHILALSGLHLGIIYMIVSKVLGIFGNGTHAKRFRSALIILFCGFYTMATGAGASILRAFIFITLGELAKMTGRHRSLIQILFASLLIQLIISPLSIRTIGFQLSYAAMAGIAFIFPWLKGFWPDERESEASTYGGRLISRSMRWIWNSAVLSISCQITTGPLAYIYFGTVPLNFIMTNLIALPLTGILIPIALLTICLSSLGWCPEWIIQGTDYLATIMMWSLQVIAG